ncbi:MAG: hypothetical protein K2P78_12965, partial [Gemmataceae bacterium]|nr:hypothetical protein [Gemmataceae bacterium]
MSRLLAVLSLGFAPVIAVAQPPAARFQWAANQTLTYKVAQQTSVTETTPDEKTQTPITTQARTNLALTRRWTVRAVDPAGVATVEMAITGLRNELRQPDGTTTVRDSANPEHAREMAEYLGRPIVVARVDSQGRLVEVKESKGGSAGRLHAELPFRLVLPDAGPAPGQGWERPFAFKLDPPHGTGESYDFVQKYTCTGAKDGTLVFGVETVLKAPPKTAGEQIPLVPLLWAGEVHFHAPTGRYAAARLKARAELPNHLGAGSKFVYESTYAEDLV